MATEPTRRLFTVEEYYRMADAGILTEDDRVELLDGEIVEMTPISARHASCVDRLNRLFSQRLASRAVVRVQNPVRLDDRTEPQPDICIARSLADGYARSHPRPGEIHLVIEVADTSVMQDRNVKITRYARSQVPEAWLVDLLSDRIEVYREPTKGRYAAPEILERGGSLSALGFPELVLDVGEILGPR